MMTIEHFLLLPTSGDGESCLNSIRLVKNEDIIIGRNPETIHGKHDNLVYLSRRHAKVRWTGDSEVFISVLTPAPGMVSVNDVELDANSQPTAVGEGDIICLIHKFKCFSYKLLGVESKDLTTAPGEETLKVESVENKKVERKVGSSKQNTAVETNGDALVSRTECAICLLPLAFAHALHPCGHQFCYPCIYDWYGVNSVCPSCQANIDGMNPSHLLNDIIEGLLSNNEDRSLLQDWKVRLEEGISLKKVHETENSRDMVASSSSSSVTTSSLCLKSAPHPSHQATPKNNILTALGATRKRVNSTMSNSTGETTHNMKKSRNSQQSTVIDLTSSNSCSSSAHNSAPQECIAFHIKASYKDDNMAKVGIVFKQILDNFGVNASGLSNACWNPQRRCKHCRHLIALNSLVVSSIGAPCHEKLFHVNCLSSYNRQLQFMGGAALDRAITFDKIINVSFLLPEDVAQLRYNTIL